MQIYSDKKFTNPVKIISAFDTKGFLKAFEEIENFKNSYYLVGYIRYEAKDVFGGKNINSAFPLLYFEAFENYEKFEPEQNKKSIWLFPKPIITYEEYENGFDKIKQQIADGNTYEVNYTFDFKVNTRYKAVDIFNNLINTQKTPYNAYLQNSCEEILSFSPELFFRKSGNSILAKPMKGTIERGKTEKDDIRNIEYLKNDTKNRAENVMIVDLLRNDLGKISTAGSVKVPKLFDIETHKTLHQMTSEIISELKPNMTLYEIFEAIFPCGSITGAPKISTINIIDSVEKGKRNVYCGAIGLIYKDFCEFSVPIRILQKQAGQDFFVYRAGGAVVWDSVPEKEWDEAVLKTAFLSENSKNWKLIETLRVEHLKPVLWIEHIARLKKSAFDLNFKFNNKISDLVFNKDGIYRILLDKSGDFQLEYRQYAEIPSRKVIISDKVINSNDIFLKYKVDFRPYYTDAVEKIRREEIYDEIFFNERGELTEGTRSNIVLDIDGKLYTPPVSCGLLCGTYREKMLKQGKCTEKILYREDLVKAENIYCINSVRGMQRVCL